MGEVKQFTRGRKVITQEMLEGYASIFDMVERHLEYQKWEEDRLLAQGWKVAPDSALEFEFGEKTAVVSRIRGVKRKPKAG